MHCLRMHVEQLAGKIGERNIFCPTALQAAASYIEHEWQQQGYALRRIAYNVSGVRCLNLEIARIGGGDQREILLIGAHYDTVTGCPGANDNARREVREGRRHRFGSRAHYAIDKQNE